MKDRCLSLVVIFILIYTAYALNVDTTINGEGDFFSWTNSNYNQFEEKINGTGIHEYNRNVSADDESSQIRVGYLYRNRNPSKRIENNSSDHFLSASSVIGLDHSVSTSSNKTTLFNATINSDAISLSTDYHITMKLGNISESISYANIEEAELLPIGPRYQSRTDLRGNYSFASKVNEDRPDLLQRDTISELRYQLDAVALVGYRDVKEIKKWERPIRVINGVALQSNESAKIYLDNALKLVKYAEKDYVGNDIKSGLYKLALDNLSEAIEDNPEYYLAHMEMAYIYGKENRSAEAIAAINKALAIEKTAEAYLTKAMIQDDLNQSLEAIKSYRLALELDPTNYMIRTNLAYDLLNIGDYKGAVIECDKALEIYPLDQIAWTMKGSAYYSLNQDDEARKAFQVAYKLGPDTEDGKEAKKFLDELNQTKSSLSG